MSTFNARATADLMLGTPSVHDWDSNPILSRNWDDFCDLNSTGKADSAIGAPTLEMFINSYNEKNGTAHRYEITSTGYNFVKDENDAEFDSSDDRDMYFSRNYDYIDWYGFWLASPYASDSYDLFVVKFEGYSGSELHTPGEISHNSCYLTGDPTDIYRFSIRPVVCLKSGTYIEKSGTSWVIK